MEEVNIDFIRVLNYYSLYLVHGVLQGTGLCISFEKGLRVRLTHPLLFTNLHQKAAQDPQENCVKISFPQNITNYKLKQKKK